MKQKLEHVHGRAGHDIHGARLNAQGAIADVRFAVEVGTRLVAQGAELFAELFVGVHASACRHAGAAREDDALDLLVAAGDVRVRGAQLRDHTLVVLARLFDFTRDDRANVGGDVDIDRAHLDVVVPAGRCGRAGDLAFQQGSVLRAHHVRGSQHDLEQPRLRARESRQLRAEVAERLVVPLVEVIRLDVMPEFVDEELVEAIGCLEARG